MPPIGDHDDVPHTLIPLALAVGLIRSKVYGDRPVAGQGRDGDFNALAGFVAATVTLYEFSSDPSERPRVLAQAELEGGLFRDGGRELRFIDGRSPKRYLAVSAVDVECVIAMLNDPQRAGEVAPRRRKLSPRRASRRAR